MAVVRQKNTFGELITLDQACELTNLGKTKVRQLASESRAVLKIGKSYRIKKTVFLDYINKAYSIA